MDEPAPEQPAPADPAPESPPSESQPAPQPETAAPASPRPVSLPEPPASSPLSGALWTALWSILLALGIAFGATAWRAIETRAAAHTILLLPTTPATDSEREERIAAFRDDALIESAEWLSPTALVQRVSSSVPPNVWAELFSEDDAWLPWLLQLRMKEPLASTDAVAERVERLRAEPRYRLVLFDQGALEADASLYRRLRQGTFAFAGALFLWGLLSVLASPPPRRRAAEALLGAILVALGIFLGGQAFRALQYPLDPTAWLRAGLAGFGLAAFLGPMLKGRVTRKLRTRDE